MKTFDFIEQLEARLPLNARLIVTKHATPELMDYETMIALPPDNRHYRLYNDGINAHWSIAGTVKFRN